MLKNYLKITYRNLAKQRTYSLINISGLTIGIACAVLIMLWVQDELSYDRFHEKADRIFRLSSRGMIGKTYSNLTQTPAPMAEALRKDFPEVEQTVRLSEAITMVGRNGDRAFTEGRLYGADSTFFDVFSFSLLKGDPKTALVEPLSIVITEETAYRYFENEDPLGKVILFNDRFQARVTGIVENVPRNSHFHFDILLSMSSIGYSRRTQWGTSNFKTYLALQEGATQDDMQSRLPDFVERHFYRNSPQWFGEEAPEGNYWEYYLQPVTDIHLKSDLNAEFEPNGNIVYVYVFSFAALMILIVACVNFMNLTTARSANRAKEVGLRKVVGSSRKQLIFQHMTEAFCLVFIALILGVLVIHFTLPYFNSFVGKVLTFSVFGDAVTFLQLLGLMAVLGIISGSYPALYLSSFRPIVVLRGNLSRGMKHSSLRNVLVVFQFGTTIVLFIATFVVAKQLDYFQNKPLGFSKEQVIVIKNPNALGDAAAAFKDALRQRSDVISVSGSQTMPGQNFYNISFRPQDAEEITLNVLSCEGEFDETLQLEMVEGRFLSPGYATDKTAIVLNETAVKLLRWDNPIGKTFSKASGTFTVIGVVKDFHFKSLHSSIEPLALIQRDSPFAFANEFITVRVNTANISTVIESIEQTWSSMTPGIQFEYSFLEDDYASLYKSETETGKVFVVFSILAVFIAGLGLLGLALFTAAQRTKEIGIRKVLGASESSIFALLSREFVCWVAVSNIVAWPISYLLMDRWLQNFAYRTEIGWTPFVLSGSLALLVALITVSYQSLKAAVANPVGALRYE